MALLTDSEIVTLDDLLKFETTLAQIASSHGINVDTKINLAIDAISNKLLLWLLSVGASDPQWMNRRSIGVSTVVVTPTLERWICFEALSRFFGEAYNVQLNTRFQSKWTEYRGEAAEAADLFFKSGAAIVNNPLPRPSLPLVSVQSGTAPAEAIFVQVAWTDSQGNEGALSAVNGQILANQSGIAVAMAEGAISVPASAIGWNVYASTSQDGLTRQNAKPLQVGSTWQLPASGLIVATQPIGGQLPDHYIALTRQIQRG